MRMVDLARQTANRPAGTVRRALTVCLGEASAAAGPVAATAVPAYLSVTGRREQVDLVPGLTARQTPYPPGQE
jgi:hypothetical protein